jgi:hypothetical protein
LDDGTGEKESENRINESGFIEYNRNNMTQLYHVEEILSMIDVSGDGSSSQSQDTDQI